jgi:two-component system, OmpR family, KDP operon response regulator KdpE
MPNQRILVVDDEQPIRQILERILTRDGYEVLQAANGEQALKLVCEEKPDLMILDLNLPDCTGEDIFTQIRKDASVHAIPILVLTGRGTDGLSAQCLNGGADDYLSKPFDLQELLARVHALLRRPALYMAADTVIEKGDIAIHIAERRVMFKGKAIERLAPKEFALLKQLVLHAPKVLDKNSLALGAWGALAERLHHRTLDVHVRRIRQKVGPEAASRLKTIPAIGYQWADR